MSRVLAFDDASIRLPVGVRDYLPRAAARRRGISERLLGVFDGWGYQRIIAPAFEYADVLERGLGADARAAAIRFVEPLTGEVVALRPDITPQVARMVATRFRGVKGAVRLCYEGAVTRLFGGARGQREVLQTGVELFGVASPEGDAEVLAVAAAALDAMHADEVRIDIGHGALARAALAGVDDPARVAELRERLAKKDRAGVEAAAAGLPKAQRELLVALPVLYGAPTRVLEHARRLRLPAPARRALDTIQQVLSLTSQAMSPTMHERMTVDLGEVRGFDYYTGIRFAGYAAGVGEAVLTGGRYDELVAAYGYPQCATGFAVDVEAIAQTERAAGVAAPEADAVLIATVASRRPLAVALAASLRAAGHRVAVEIGKPRSAAALSRYAESVGLGRVLSIDGAGGKARAVASGDGGTAVSNAALERGARGDVGSVERALDLPVTAKRSARPVIGDTGENMGVRPGENNTMRSS